MTVIEQADLDKHVPKIVFQEGLEDLTAKQIREICFLMEREYRKGKQENSLEPIELKSPLQLIKEELRKEIEMRASYI